VKESFGSMEDSVPAKESQNRSNGTHQANSHRGTTIAPEIGVDSDIRTKLDALARERDTLRQEVSELRKSLEDIRGKHEQDIAELQGQVEESETGKKHAETQYRDLLGRVNGIKAQLGERLKADAVRDFVAFSFTLNNSNASTGRDFTSKVSDRGT
jgi:DNA repair exonuclease SbcCD ATPase subunit